MALRHGFISVSLLCGLFVSAAAHEVDTRHGVITDALPALTTEGGISASLQAVRGDRARNELQASFDWLSSLPLGAGRFTLYVEGSTTPQQDGVSAMFPVANGDAGTALDGTGSGRLQVSEAYYIQPLEAGSLYAGLIDPTAFLDGSSVANDETHQFIASPLVNNPSIAFPDYTLGVAWHGNSDPQRPGWLLFIGSSHGLGDNPKASYPELFDVTAAGKGVFAAFEGYLPHNAWTLRPGVWLNTARQPRLEQPTEQEDNYGVYLSVDGASGDLQWNLRLGAANDTVSRIAQFAALAVQYPFAGVQWGLGVAQSYWSERAEDRPATVSTQAELYSRFELAENLTLTPALQYLRKPDRADDLDSERGPVWLAGLRVSWRF